MLQDVLPSPSAVARYRDEEVAAPWTQLRFWSWFVSLVQVTSRLCLRALKTNQRKMRGRNPSRKRGKTHGGDTQVHIALQCGLLAPMAAGREGGAPPTKSHYGVLCNFRLGLASTPLVRLTAA